MGVCVPPWDTLEIPFRNYYMLYRNLFGNFRSTDRNPFSEFFSPLSEFFQSFPGCVGIKQVRNNPIPQLFYYPGVCGREVGCGTDSYRI